MNNSFHYNDITGQKFNKLTAIKPAEYAMHGKCTKWYCQCECGNVAVVSYDHLKSGHTKSCGCLRQKYGKALQKGEQHGMANTPLYKVWQAMKDRIYNKNNKYFHYYGGRGLTLCEEWESFSAFNKWAMENGYQKGLDLDRINNDLGYSPENCRWIPHAENLQNTRRKQEVVLDGKRVPVAEIAKRYNVPYNKVYQMNKRGLSGKQIIAILETWEWI